MYVTRRLSIYKKCPKADLDRPPEGPNSGILIIQDEESEESGGTCCLGPCEGGPVRDLPFPQNKILTVRSTTRHEQVCRTVHRNRVLFVPVINQPLSSNRYYVILMDDGKYRGHACTCSRMEDMETYCCGNHITDVRPRAFDYRDVYQQVEVTPLHRASFIAKSIAAVGFPPLFLRRKGWGIYASTPYECKLQEANGIDVSLRSRLPISEFPISSKRSAAVVVGKWYCPFTFIKEEGVLKYQMRKSTFYEMHLEQWWEEIYACENDGSQGNVVVVNASVQGDVARVFGEEVEEDDTSANDTSHSVDGMVWFRPVSSMEGRLGVGLSIAVVDRMKWEACRGGWIDGKEKDVRVERVEEFGGGNGWRMFGCYVLVESFVLRRMDGSLLLTHDFRHAHMLQSKWE